MTRFRWLFGLVVVGVAVVGASLLHAAGRRSSENSSGDAAGVKAKEAPAQAQCEHGPQDVVMTPMTPLPFFDVWSPNKEMKPEEKQVFDRVRETLTGIRFVPEHRVKHFSWLKDHHFLATGWAAELMNAEPIESGLLVSLKITPRTGPMGTSMFAIYDHSIERYKVFDDGTWTFVDGTTPPGQGKPGWSLH